MFTISGASVCRSPWACRWLNHLLSFSCSFYLASVPRDTPLTWITFGSVWCNMNPLLSPSLTVVKRNNDLLGSVHREELAKDSTAVRGFSLRCSHWLLFASVRRPEVSRALRRTGNQGRRRNVTPDHSCCFLEAWLSTTYPDVPRAGTFWPCEHEHLDAIPNPQPFPSFLRALLFVLLCVFLSCFKKTILKYHLKLPLRCLLMETCGPLGWITKFLKEMNAIPPATTLVLSLPTGGYFQIYCPV